MHSQTLELAENLIILGFYFTILVFELFLCESLLKLAEFLLSRKSLNNKRIESLRLD